jgi:hypothetical protein
MVQNKMTARKIDENGFLRIEMNPISRVGVFPYLGKSIGAEDPERVYNVYRPAETLSEPEAIESFKLKPIVDDHEFLGPEGDGAIPADKHGVHGTIGENIVYKDGVLFANLKIFSEKLKGLIEKGKRDLSLGYRCVYEKMDGMFDGQPYEYVQRQMRGNHLALVDEARCNVAVLDHKLTFDSLDISITKENEMDPEKKDDKAQDEVTLESLAKAIGEIAAMLKSVVKKDEPAVEADADKATEKKEGDEDKAAEKKEGDEEVDLKKGEEGNNSNAEALSKVVDSVEKLAKKFNNHVATVSQQVAQDMADKAVLVEKLSEAVGTFDSKAMTTAQVAEYGVKKLGLDCAKGHEVAAIKGYLAAHKKAATSSKASDSKAVPSKGVSAYITAQA